MLKINEVKIPIKNDNKDFILKKVSKILRINTSEIIEYKILKKSIDARDKNNILYIYEFAVKTNNEQKLINKNISLYIDKKYEFNVNGNTKLDKRPIIVGTGPAGLFASYMLSSVGFNPIILERGEKIEDRVKTVEQFFKNNILNKESNIQFGEGGAGTFSDGKLNSLTKDKLNRHKKVFEIFVENGAPEEILYVNKPHIGTDILRKVIINMRNKIISMGGEFRYSSKVTNLIIDNNKIKGVIVNDNEKIYSDIVILAIGHSARDTFYMLNENNVLMKPKNFAMGLRIEHPREMIDKNQYGKDYNLLPTASYKLTYTTKNNRSVYSFCMCPGGFVVNASSEEKRLCINGMSNYKRDERNSNSAIVVNVTTSDFNNELFGGLELQRKLEQLAYIEGNGLIPIQLYKDFVNDQKSTKLGEIIPNTKGKYALSNLNNILPKYISESIKEAIPEFGKKIKGFDREDAVLLGIEARTSSPVVIVRNDEFISSIDGLYPCGEGAGYAGGITTAAIDGIKISEKICSKYKSMFEETLEKK